MIHVLTESSGSLAIKDQQLSQAPGITERFLVFADRPDGSRDRRLLSQECIRPETSINGLLVWLQRVFPQTEASMQKVSISLIGGVEILEHAQQGGTIKTRQVGLYVCPCRL
jgi:hypothetical protein